MIRKNIITLNSGTEIVIKPVDARRLYIDISNITFLKSKLDNSDHSVSIEDSFNIEKGDKIHLTINGTDYVYQIQHINIDEKNKLLILYSTNPTKTTIFLLPILGGNLRQFEYDSYFVNAYLDVSYKFICLMYRFINTDVYKRFEHGIMTDPRCVSHMEHGTDHVVFFFKIPSSYDEDVQRFIRGEYSKLSDLLRECIIDFNYYEDSIYIFNILDQSEALRRNMEIVLDVKLPKDAEVASKPDLNIEIYKPYE